jgi:hypothetical protein
VNKCTWPIPCKNDCFEDHEFCRDHCKAQGISIRTPPKEKKAIAKRSKKQVDIMKELSLMYPVFLEKHPVCELKLKGCTYNAETVHHLAGRIGDQVFEVKDWMASCFWCNNAIENDPEAHQKGLKKSIHTKN